MSGWFIFTIIVAVAALVISVASFVNVDGDRLSGSARTMVIAACLSVVVLFTFISSAFVVPTRSVGVATAFGKPDAHSLPNGFHLVKPWKSVEKISTATQTLNLIGDNKDGNPCVTVRLANATTACVDVSVQWNITDDGVVELYRQYKPRGSDEDVFHNIETNLVKRQTTDALNVTFSDYNPLASINGVTDGSQVKLHDLAAKAQNLLQAELHEAVKDGVRIRSVIFTVVHFDPVSQDKLNAYAQALADTRIAQQRLLTAQAQKAANEALAGSAASQNPGVLYQNCLDMTERLVREGKTLSPAWSCGAPPSVVVPVK